MPVGLRTGTQECAPIIVHALKKQCNAYIDAYHRIIINLARRKVALRTGKHDY